MHSTHARTKWSMKRACSNASCGKTARVFSAILFTGFFASKAGGTHKGVGFDCPFCETRNEIAQNILPKGMINTLPSEEEWRSRQELTQSVNGGSKISPPVWITGRTAFNVLCADIKRAQSSNGSILVLVENPTLGHCFHQPSAEDLAPHNILAYLDQVSCGLLIVAGTSEDGSRWKTVFHPAAGAASMTVEPK